MVIYYGILDEILKMLCWVPRKRAVFVCFKIYRLLYGPKEAKLVISGLTYPYRKRLVTKRKVDKHVLKIFNWV